MSRAIKTNLEQLKLCQRYLTDSVIANYQNMLITQLKANVPRYILKNDGTYEIKYSVDVEEKISEIQGELVSYIIEYYPDLIIPHSPQQNRIFKELIND